MSSGLVVAMDGDLYEQWGLRDSVDDEILACGFSARGTCACSYRRAYPGGPVYAAQADCARQEVEAWSRPVQACACA